MACRDWAAKVGGGVLGRVWALIAALALLLGLAAMAPAPAQAASFRDVSSGQWYTSWVDKASDQGLMSGFTDPATGRPTGYFGPDEPLTRAQVATVLWRMAGGPSSGHASFPDVERGSWYDAPVAWCVKAGVVTGYTSGPDKGCFRPSRPVTRQELATMVYRYAKYAGMDVADPDPTAFRSTTDWRTVDSWASEALTWTAAAGVLSGVDNHDGTYSVVPFGTATRAMAAKVFVVLSGSPSAAKASYTVTFDSNGGTAVKAQAVKNGAKASKPADPAKSGYAFKGWYSDKSLTKAYNFNSTVRSNLTLYAKWEAKATYTVTFNANGGTAVKAQSVSSGAKVSKPANPAKAGHAFKGWYSDKSLTKAYDFNSAVKSNLTLYAKWEANKYTVTFVSNGGTSVSKQTVAYGAKASKPSDPALDDSQFVGWYTDAACTEAYDFGSAVRSDLALYAKWEKRATYTVTFDANGGTAVEAQSVSSGARASKPANPTRAGHAFKGWYSDKSLTKAYDFNSAVKSNLTLYAKWAKAATYTVTFNSNGGSSVKAQTVAAGSRAAIPTAPTRPGYAFTGWYASKSATQYNDGSYRADGRGIGGKVPVTVVVSGGRVSEVCVGDNSETRGIGSKAIERIPGEIVRQNGTDNVDVVSGATVTSKAIVAAVGECLAKAGRGEVYDFACAVNDDTTLYAGWVKAGFVVSFDGNGSHYGSAQFVLPGSKAVAPANPARPDGTLTFSGWYSDSKLTNRYDFSVPVTVDLTLYAKWDSQTQLYAILYSDGLLSLQKGSDEGASHGTVLGKWVWDASSRPWYDKRARVKSVVVRDGIAASNGGGMFSDLSNCRSMDLSKLDVSGASGLSHMFSDCSRLQSLDLSRWDVSNASDFSDMFSGCSRLQSLDVSSWGVSNASDLSWMFDGCSSLASLDVSGWDVSNASDLSRMFDGCSSLASLDVSGWDVSNASSLSSMFSGCSSLASLDVSGWDVSNVTSFMDPSNPFEGGMFYGCSSLTSLDLSGWDVSGVSDLSGMFSGCSSLVSLDLSGWDVSNVTSFTNFIYDGGMFYGCSSLTSLDLSGWDVSNASSLSGMFYGCSSLTSLDVSGWDVSGASDLRGMFHHCSSLTSLDLSGWDVSGASRLSSMFEDCSSLGTVTLGVGCGPLVGELPYGPWYDAEGKEHDRPPAGVAGTFTKTKPAALAVAADAASDADALLPAQIVEGEQGGLRYVVVPEGASFEYGLEYPELAGRYVGPGAYLTGYAGEGDSLVVPLEVADVPVVSANLSWNDSDRAGMTRLASISFERVEGKVSSLAQLDVSGNGLSSLDIEGLDALVRLNCEGNPIADLVALQAWAAQDGHEAKLPQAQDVAPAEPGDAAAPSEPSAPEQPSEPDTPAVEPGEPSEPDVPAEPEVPSEPEAPATPEVPSEPEEPSVEPSLDEAPSDDFATSDEADLSSDSLELGEGPISALAA